MIRYGAIYNAPVFAPKKGKAKRDKSGKEQEAFSKLGRVRRAVFTPDGRQMVGLLIKRPDVAGMIKRDELFVGIDSFVVAGKTLRVTRGDDSYDEAARRRLGIDWESCIIWTGMDAKTTDGYELGYVNDSEFEELTGKVSKFYVGDDGVARTLVGSFEIPAEMVRGYSKGYMLVDPEARNLKLNGGLAAKAGEVTGKAQVGLQQTNERATQGAVEALDKGSHDFGKMIADTKRAYQQEAGTAKQGNAAKGKQDATHTDAAHALGRQLGRMGSMFGNFAEEYKKSSK